MKTKCSTLPALLNCCFLRKWVNRMHNFIDLTGQRFGRLVVIERTTNKGDHPSWLCRCDCGGEKIVRGSDLKSGHTQSCGCLHKEVVTSILEQRTNKHTHGKSRTRLYRIWSAMKSRCFDKKRECFKHYGGRGIAVCIEWKDNFQSFHDWAMANGYEEHLTIDRIDVNGNYEPSNCRWITLEQQQTNRTNTKKQG